MKTRLLQRTAFLFCLTAVFFSLTACNKDTERNDIKNNEVENQSYIASFFDIPETVTDVSRLQVYNNKAYLCCSETDTASFLAAIDIDSREFQKLPLDGDSSINILDFGIDLSGNIWAACSSRDEGYSLRKLDISGAALNYVDLSSIIDATVVSAVGSEVFLSIDSSGNICVAIKYINTYAYLFDSNGQFLFDLYYDGNLLTTITTAEGKIGVCTTAQDRMNYNLLTVDMDKKKWSDEVVFLGTVAGLYGGNSDSFYLFDSSSLYGYSSGTEERRHIFNWTDIGLNVAGTQLCELPDGKFFILSAKSNQTSELSYELTILSEGSNDRIVLSMISLSAEPSIIQAISDFNKNNTKYMIELTEYFPYEENVSDEDWDDAILNLNTQIIAGNIPDILDMKDLPVAIYHNKGLLENLYTYIENDSEININDYYGNVFDAISIDGKLPFITNGVGIDTMTIDKSIISSNGWSLSDLKSFLNDYGASSIYNLNGEFFLKVMLMTSDRFVDWAKGECYFDSPEFIELLELAAMIQENIGNNFGAAIDASFIASYETVLNVYQVAQHRNIYQGNLNFIGLPNDSGEYHAIKPEVKIGISSASGNKGVAWAFVRTFLTKEHQTSCLLLPIHKDVFDTTMQAAIEGKSTWAQSYWDIKVTQEDVKIIESLLSNAAHAVNDNQPLEEIVLDEAFEYFSGIRTVQDVASNIQSRASIYINE